MERESKVNKDNHIVIQGWMITELNLKGNDLLVYAIIYGFSQDGQSVFHGSRQYLADWCNSTVRGIQKNLDNLKEMNLLEPIETKPGAFVSYKAYRCPTVSVTIGENISSEQSSQVPVNKVPTTSEQSSHNNIVDSIDIKDSNSILKNTTAKQSGRNIPLFDNSVTKKDDKKKLNLYEKCKVEIDTFTSDKALQDALTNFITMRLKMKDKPILGVGQFKGMLKLLSGLEGDKVKIVETATARGWASFYELKNNNYQYQKRDKFAEGGIVKSVSPDKVEGGQFSGQIF